MHIVPRHLPPQNEMYQPSSNELSRQENWLVCDAVKWHPSKSFPWLSICHQQCGCESKHESLWQPELSLDDKNSKVVAVVDDSVVAIAHRSPSSLAKAFLGMVSKTIALLHTFAHSHTHTVQSVSSKRKNKGCPVHHKGCGKWDQWDWVWFNRKNDFRDTVWLGSNLSN